MLSITVSELMIIGVIPHRNKPLMKYENHIVTLSNGIKVINTSPHPFIFDDGTVVKPIPDLVTGGRKGLNAEAYEVEHPQGEPFQSTGWDALEGGLVFLVRLPDDVLVLASSIAAQAYGYPVVSTVPTPETSGRGVAYKDKRVRSDRFNLFGCNPDLVKINWGE